MRGGATSGGRALVIGETLIDIARAPSGTVRTHPGGAAANVALGLARLGRPVDLATHVGHDADGVAVVSPLEAAGAVRSGFESWRRSGRTAGTTSSAVPLR
jgi:fructokinase